LPQEALEDLVTQYEERVIDLPTRESADPDGRHQRAKDLAKQAREKEKQVRPRTVTVSTGPTKDEADQYLRSNYTNADGRMVCQICNRELPFRLADGSYYFERVELIPGLSREHPQNHLALCPNHGAMWRYANGSRESLAELVDAMKGNLLTVELAGRPRKARFTETHVVDLRAVLEAELEEATSD
jgi:hypothetical protein